MDNTVQGETEGAAFVCHGDSLKGGEGKRREGTGLIAVFNYL